MRKQGLKLYFDGGCRPNPGEMETAVVARGVTYHRSNLGHGTNNDAEWLALIHALNVALSLGETELELIGDSALVVNQANGVWKCRSADLRTHLTKFEILATHFSRIRIKHIGRSRNLAGIALARQRIGL
ncbi:ribonuclease HI family protein [Sphingomonas cavernae]|uniref:Reverse transcriptase-like protein n=1 Tax=Sphingomonas cavernae TaxID=2320861 RepID=A0A418W6Z7_9SPHN|nr:ribonuclease HI family protein [Sphingomonas cavernae]RJF85816.1 reverse transcriptase-like protein [Sphingomonas cavernae]